MSPRTGARILMTTDAVGGVWSYSTSLAAALAARGWRVMLITLGPSPKPHQLAGLNDHPRIESCRTDFALEWMDPDGKDWPRAAEGLTAIAEKFRPDIVHLNSYREACAGWNAPVLVA